MSLKYAGLTPAAILLAAIAGIGAARRVSDFAGTWVMNYQGQPIFKLSLSAEHGRLTGSLTVPQGLTIDSDGDVTAIGPDLSTKPVQKAVLRREQLELTINGDGLIMTLQGTNGASLVIPGVRPLPLERIADGKAVVLASSLALPDYPEEIRKLREQLRAMVKDDQVARLNYAGARIEATDLKNRSEVLAIFDRYGWVTNSLAGKEAAHGFWLLVQHQTPQIQRRLLPALEKAAKAGEASMSDYAYLYDRIQAGLGKPQHWGTQTRCEKRKPVLYPVDDPAGLEARRQELFMPSVRDYLKMEYLVRSCAQTR